MDSKILHTLRTIRKALGIFDLGVNADLKEIYLLSSARQLTRAVRGRFRAEATAKVYGHEALRYGQNFDETWDGLRDAVTSWLSRATGDESWYDYVVIPIPTPGGPQHPWLSAKTGKVMPPVAVSEYSLCSETAETRSGSVTHPAVLTYGGRDLPPIFLSHGIGLHDFEIVKKCGGLLWPSFALTWRIPPAYGDIVMLPSIDLLLGSVKHARAGRISNDVIVYNTDMWSPAGRELTNFEQAMTLERRGDRRMWTGGMSERDPGYMGRRDLQADLLSLKSGSEDFQVGGMMAGESGARRLKTMRSIWARVRHLLKTHTKDAGVGVYDYEDEDRLTRRVETIDRYQYLEVKVVGKLSFGQLPVCLYPAAHELAVFAFLNDMGFRGMAVPFAYDGPTADESSSEDRVRWAKAATAALLEWAGNACGRGRIFGDDLRSEYADRRPYQAIFDYDGAGYYSGPGYGYCPGGTS